MSDPMSETVCLELGGTAFVVFVHRPTPRCKECGRGGDVDRESDTVRIERDKDGELVIRVNGEEYVSPQDVSDAVGDALIEEEEMRDG